MNEDPGKFGSITSTNSNLSSSPLSKVFTYLKDNLKELVVAFLRVMPEALLAGALVIGIATQSIPYMMLGVAMLVFKLSSNLLGSFLKTTLDEPSLRGSSVDNCSLDIPSIYKYNATDATIRSSAVPAANIFFVVAVIFYCVNNVYKFTEELDALKRDDVLPVSAVFGSLIILIFLLWRSKEGCNTKEVLLLSTFFAAGVAYLVSFSFEHIFGRESINLLGIPVLVDEQVDAGSNIISCSN
jgi:hypothetical protein